MAVNKCHILKKCRVLGLSPTLVGIAKQSKRNPRASRRKSSNYGTQLKEKQKAKFVYGVLEKQFRNYYKRASESKDNTGEKLLQILESRLDNVAFRLGFAKTRRESRQLVTHGHFTVNGHKVNIPSFLVKIGDVIEIREKSKSNKKIKSILETLGNIAVPRWLVLDKEKTKGEVLILPSKEDIDLPVEVHFIVELYSK
ncbi:MAG: 30S ribosomal protein S4 [Clostridiales bacterium]|jgi:small subunit ribosomal protein S4|nr:30S ribosomal protein S4 [Clostridiales bacterium]